MSAECFDIGTIQAFLDGETAPELSASVTNHAAECVACALLIAEAEEQSSIVFSALDREFNTLVPTQRLWTRINDTIAVEKGSASWWQRFTGVFALQFSSPSFAAAAGIVMILGIFAVVTGIRDIRSRNTELASLWPTVNISHPQSVAAPSTVNESITTSDDIPNATHASVDKSNVAPEKLRKIVISTRLEEERSRPHFENAVAVDSRSIAPATEYLAGEESYVKTISELKQSVDGQKDRVLSPSSRVEYERSMAVVNDSITRMKDAVRTNPRNQSAKQVLYSAYQDKIDLLNSVVQREELIASLR